MLRRSPRRGEGTRSPRDREQSEPHSPQGIWSMRPRALRSLPRDPSTTPNTSSQQKSVLHHSQAATDWQCWTATRAERLVHSRKREVDSQPRRSGLRERRQSFLVSMPRILPVLLQLRTFSASALSIPSTSCILLTIYWPDCERMILTALSADARRDLPDPC